MDIKVGDRFRDGRGRVWEAARLGADVDEGLWTLKSENLERLSTRESIAGNVECGAWARIEEPAVCPTCDALGACPECKADVATVEAARAEPGEPVPYVPETNEDIRIGDRFDKAIGLLTKAREELLEMVADEKRAEPLGYIHRSFSVGFPVSPEVAAVIHEQAMKCLPGCTPAAPCFNTFCPAVKEYGVDSQMSWLRLKRAIASCYDAIRTHEPVPHEPSYSGLGALACSTMGPQRWR